jgi:hypothetical protein
VSAANKLKWDVKYVIEFGESLVYVKNSIIGIMNSSSYEDDVNETVR